MKIIAALALAILVTACVPGPREICHRGVAYLKTGTNARGAMTVAVDRSGKPIACTEAPRDVS